MPSHDSVAVTRLHRASVGRGDLLRLLASLGEKEVERAARLVGFEVMDDLPHDVDLHLDRLLAFRGEAAGAPKEASSTTPRPLRTTQISLVSRVVVAPMGDSDPEVSPDNVLKDVPEGDVAAALPALIELSPPRRMATLLRRVLRHTEASPVLNIDFLVDELARARFPTRLPLRRLPSWRGSSALLIDATPAMRPVLSDLLCVMEQAVRISGHGVTVYLRSFDGSWWRLGRGQQGGHPRCLASSARSVASARHCLVAGDVGFVTKDAATLALWRQLSQRLASAGGRLTCLIPSHLHPAASHFGESNQVVPWDRGSSLRPVRLHTGAGVAGQTLPNADPVAVQRLIACMALAVRVEPDLLRALRTQLALSIDDEISAWLHEDVERCPLAAQVRADKLEAYRELLRREPEPLRRCIATLVRRHHARLSPFILMEEAALATDLADESAGEASDFWRLAAQTVQTQPFSQASGAIARYVGRAAGRAHPELWNAVPEFARAWLVAHCEQLRAGMDLPAGMPMALVHRTLSMPATGSARPLRLVVDRDRLILQDSEAQSGQSTAAGLLATDALVFQTGTEAARCIAIESLPLELTDLDQGGPWNVRTPFESLTFARVRRPPWARGWGRDQEGLFVLAPRLLEAEVRLRVEGGTSSSSTALAASGFMAPPVSVHRDIVTGVEEAFGVYADVRFNDIFMRFKWVPQAGKEEGFWMSETAVTQALWNSVTRWRPDVEASDALPVHSVNEVDIDDFLRRMNHLLPQELSADLPSEAQWQQAFEGGNTIGAPRSDRGAPADASSPFTPESNDAPVSATAWLRPNELGLRGMHGYAWEWCRNTFDSPVSHGSGVRALRGGCREHESRWLSSVAFERAAASVQDRHRLLGLRLVLTSRSTRNSLTVHLPR